MRISEMNWMQVERYLERDDRAVIPLGSTEQHAYLSLCTDSILCERVSIEAAEPLGVPVFPVQSYGLCPYFGAYPGTVSLRVETYVNLIQDLLDSLAGGGFRRILLLSGHGGNEPARQASLEWMSRHPEVRVRFHQWWQGRRFVKAVEDLDPVHGHASWFENFPFTRVEGVEFPDEKKSLPDRSGKTPLVGKKLRNFLGDGNTGGVYIRPDEDMAALWQAGVEETRQILDEGWD